MAIELVARDPATWGPSLAAVQEALAGASGDTGRGPEALTVSRQAVELRRAAGAPHDVAVALRVFAQVRAAAGPSRRRRSRPSRRRYCTWTSRPGWPTRAGTRRRPR